MKRFVLIVMLIMAYCILMAIDSYTDSGPVTLDTVAPVLQLTSPNGGETWYIGDTKEILWTATDLHLNLNSVDLWYSTNGGVNYTSIVSGIPHTGSYFWILPSTQSNNSKVKIGISDDYGNLANIISANSFSISYVPPAPPTGLIVNTLNGVDAVLSWDAVTQTIPPYNTPITPDGYIILYNETPYEDEQFYYFLGRSYTTNYTHSDVVEFRDQMFYKVIAYKYYTRSEEEALNSLLIANKDKSILWVEAQNMLEKGAEK